MPHSCRGQRRSLTLLTYVAALFFLTLPVFVDVSLAEPLRFYGSSAQRLSHEISNDTTSLTSLHPDRAKRSTGSRLLEPVPRNGVFGKPVSRVSGDFLNSVVTNGTGNAFGGSPNPFRLTTNIYSNPVTASINPRNFQHDLRSDSDYYLKSRPNRTTQPVKRILREEKKNRQERLIIKTFRAKSTHSLS